MSSFENASKAHDQIFIVLPDGREVIGKALVVQDSVMWPGGGGRVECNFVIPDATPGMEICVVMMKLDTPIRQRIIL